MTVKRNPPKLSMAQLPTCLLLIVWMLVYTACLSDGLDSSGGNHPYYKQSTQECPKCESPPSPQVYTTENRLLERYAQHVSSPAQILNAAASAVPATTTEGNDDEDIVSNRTRYSNNMSAECRTDVTQIVESAMLQRAGWALKFLDAWGKPPPGVLLGDLVWSGSYGECTQLTSPADTTTGHQQGGHPHTFVGKYCSVIYQNISIIPEKLRTVFLNLTEGVCFPNSCSTKDIQTIIVTAISLANLSDLGVVHSVECQPTVTDKTHYTTEAIVMCASFSLLGLFIILGTFYDVTFHQRSLQKDQRSLELSTVSMADENTDEMARGQNEYTPLVAHRSVPEKQILGLPFRFLLCFSVYTNIAKILSVDPGSKDSLGCLHGIRVLSINWIILSHTYYYSYMYSLFRNFTEVMTAISKWTFQLVLGGSLVVDTFFLISGTLVAYLTLKRLEVKGGPRHFNWGLFYLHRFWRLTPTYMMVLALYTAFFQYMGEGPFWMGEHVSAACKKFWWANILYIQNFWRPDHQCMGWTWYLANDMQFYVLSPLIVILMYIKPWAGVFVSACLLAASFLSTCFISSIYHLGPGVQGLMHSMLHTNSSPKHLLMEFYLDIYNPPWTRVGPYLIGLLLGMCLHKTKLTLRMRWGFVLLGWLLMSVCTLTVLLGLQGVIQGSRSLNNHTSALFNALYRSVWALGVAWLVFACLHGYGGIINTILSWPAFIPLSRLTFMAYIVHPIVVTLYYLQIKQRLVYDTMTITYIYLANLVAAYALGLVASLVFEAPMIALERLLLRRKH